MTDTPAQALGAPELADDFGWALGSLFRAYVKQVEGALRDVPGGPRGYRVLVIAAANSCQNQAAIAERLDLDRTIMTSLIDGLEAKLLIVRAPDPGDRRARRVILTEQGAQLLEQLTVRMRRVEDRLLADLAPADSELLRTLVSRTARLVSGSLTENEVCTGAESL